MALIIFGKMHFLLISENEFFHEIKCNRMTSFMKFMFAVMNNALSSIKTFMTSLGGIKMRNVWFIHKILIFFGSYLMVGEVCRDLMSVKMIYVEKREQSE